MALREKAVTHGKPPYICSEFESWVFIRAPVALKHCTDSPALWWQCHCPRCQRSSPPLLPATALGRLAGFRCSVFFAGEKRDL